MKKDMRSRKFWERRYDMETIRLILIVCILLDAPAALTFEVAPTALEIALVAGAFMTLLIELIQDY